MEREPALRIGMRLEVTRKGTQHAHYAKVEDVSTWEFAVSSLFGGGEADVLQSGEQVECFFTDSGTHDQYGFTAIVLRREARVFPMYFMSMPREYERIQRRRFVRYPVLLPTQFRLYEDKSWQKGFLVDISGGGARLSHREALSSGDLIQVSFSLKQHEPNIVIAGKVVRSDALQGPGSGMYHSGVEFENISISVQDRIVGFVFQRMLEQRRLQEW
ncbi:MAG: hypothetical protein FD169_1158 [Bacillota bacterium]|nr:MAG: hypothetical protein FD169_1158 [Bacillota bacterium]